MARAPADAVDRIVGQWEDIRPDIDSSPIHIVGRVSRLSRLIDRCLSDNFARHGLEQWMYDVLATLRPSAHPGLVPPPRDGGELFAVLGSVDVDEVQPLIQGTSGGHGHAVLLDVAAWTSAAAETRPVAGVAPPARALADAGWTVLVGRPERGPDRVWNDFCRRLPVRLGTGR